MSRQEIGRGCRDVQASPARGFLRTYSAWKTRGVADALGLEEMAALVGRDGFEAGGDGEAQARDERVPETDAVDVFVARGEEEFAAGLIAGEEAVEHGEIDVGSGANFWRSGGAFGGRGRLDEGAEEPAAEPAEAEVVDGRIRLVF